MQVALGRHADALVEMRHELNYLRTALVNNVEVRRRI